MTRPLRTNPAYAHLAYKKAIIQDTINYLLTDVLGANGTAPKHKIYSEDVLQVDAVVPLEDIQQFVEELQVREAHLDLELSKFEFTRKADPNEQQKAETGTQEQKKVGN